MAADLTRGAAAGGPRRCAAAGYNPKPMIDRPPVYSRSSLGRTICLVAAGLVLFGCSRPASRPNVLLITIDTLRADHLGCYGYGRATTPRIDRLAGESALFTRVTAALPRTTQSIASIMTGRFPKGHGARGLFASLPAANVTLAEVFQQAGYDTGAVLSNMFLRPGRGFEQGFAYFDNPPPRHDGDSAGAVTATALRWLRGRRGDRPWFLWVHYLDPHWTYRPDPPFDRRFDPAFDGPFTLYDDLASGRFTKGQVIFRDPLSPRQIEHVVALYDGEIAQVDAALAPLLDEVDRPGSAPLLTLLTSDHGESLGEHGYSFAHGEYLYEESLRVPLLVRYPGRVPPGLRVGSAAQNIDVAPTLLALAGISRLQAADGRPLLIFDSGPGSEPGSGPVGQEGGGLAHPAPGRPLVFAESDFQLIHPENPRYFIPGPAGRWSSVSDGRYKVIRIPRPNGEFLEMYDLEKDPGELHDLSGAGPATLEIRDRLVREIRKYGDEQPGFGTPARPEALEPEEERRLRSLGYVN